LAKEAASGPVRVMLRVVRLGMGRRKAGRRRKIYGRPKVKPTLFMIVKVVLPGHRYYAFRAL
jgi:hypothetical protein